MARYILMAKRVFRHHGRQMTRGEVFEASTLDAVALTYSGKAMFAPAKKVAAPSIPLTAIHVPIMPPDPPPIQDIFPNGDPQRESGGSPDEELPKPKRRYRRRDLEPETSTTESTE